MLDIFNNIESAKIKLFDMTMLEEERNRVYFVDNDFYDNKYNMVGNLKYFCIKEREVTDWQNYCESNSIIENKNNIIYFSNYKKVLTK